MPSILLLQGLNCQTRNRIMRPYKHTCVYCGHSRTRYLKFGVFLLGCHAVTGLLAWCPGHRRCAVLFPGLELGVEGGQFPVRKDRGCAPGLCSCAAPEAGEGLVFIQSGEVGPRGAWEPPSCHAGRYALGQGANGLALSDAGWRPSRKSWSGCCGPCS